jgi:hypothetical protein
MQVRSNGVVEETITEVLLDSWCSAFPRAGVSKYAFSPQHFSKAEHVSRCSDTCCAKLNAFAPLLSSYPLAAMFNRVHTRLLLHVDVFCLSCIYISKGLPPPAADPWASDVTKF